MIENEKMVLIVTISAENKLKIEMFGQNLEEKLKTYYLQQICAERAQLLTQSILNKTTCP